MASSGHSHFWNLCYTSSGLVLIALHIYLLFPPVSQNTADVLLSVSVGLCSVSCKGHSGWVWHHQQMVHWLSYCSQKTLLVYEKKKKSISSISGRWLIARVMVWHYQQVVCWLIISVSRNTVGVWPKKKPQKTKLHHQQVVLWLIACVFFRECCGWMASPPSSLLSRYSCLFQGIRLTHDLTLCSFDSLPLYVSGNTASVWHRWHVVL